MAIKELLELHSQEELQQSTWHAGLLRNMAHNCGIKYMPLLIMLIQVGYSIRFDDATTSETRIKYVTDGMLLRELQSSPNLAAYSVIILDEAHERSLRTDLLLGLIKFILPQRPELRLVVMSATLDAERFREFFEIDGKKAEIGYVEGRSYPVEVVNTSDLATTFDGAGSGDYIEGALRCILQIHMTKEEGDILVFLTGMILAAHVYNQDKMT